MLECADELERTASMTKSKGSAVPAAKPRKTASDDQHAMNKARPGLSIPKEEAAAERKEESLIDLDLVRRCQAGEDAAFEQLVVRYQRKVYTIALGMVRSPDDAMDIAQEAFIKVHRYLGNFQGSSSFYTWLYRIIVNLCIDHLRRRNRFASTELDERTMDKAELDGEGLVLSSDLGSNPAKSIGRKELMEQIQCAVDRLPPYHRAVILMREVEGMSYSEMAKAMKVSKGTIMSRLHHARQKMQRALGDYLEGELIVK
jgi:RNA polymerase sigma-70 factor (ECF subfamily)